MPQNLYLPRVELADAILSAVPALVVSLEDGTILWASEVLEQMFGFTVFGELAGRNVDELVPESFREHHKTYREEYAKKPRARPMGANLDLYGKHQDGFNFPVYILLRPRVINGTRCVVVVCFRKPEQQSAQTPVSPSQENPTSSQQSPTSGKVNS